MDGVSLHVAKHRTENTLVNCEHVEIQSPEKTTKKSQLWESEDQNLAETSTFWSKQNSKQTARLALLAGLL
jgi:hypothetical protein